eukprot:gene7772-9570_t
MTILGSLTQISSVRPVSSTSSSISRFSSSSIQGSNSVACGGCGGAGGLLPGVGGLVGGVVGGVGIAVGGIVGGVGHLLGDVLYGGYEKDSSTTSNDGIAIIGFGIRFPGESNDLDQFWKVLIEKIDAVTDVDPERFHPSIAINEQELKKMGSIKDWKRFDPLFFGVPPIEVSKIDPQQRLLAKVAWETLEDTLFNINQEEITVDSQSLETNWIKSCVGRITISPHCQERVEAKEDMDLLLNKTEYYTTISSDEFYRSLKINTKMVYGPHFQLVTDAKLGQDFILAKITMEKQTSIFDQSIFNPTKLDNHTTLLMNQFPEGCVFKGVEDLRYYSSNIPKNRSDYKFLYSKTNYLKWDGKFFVTSQRIFTEDGTILLETEKGKLLPLYNRKLKDLRIKYPSNELYSSFWQSKENPYVNNQIMIDQEIENYEYPQTYIKAAILIPLFEKALILNSDNLFMGKLLTRTIVRYIRPLIVENQEKRIIRILELGSGTGTLSSHILEELTKLMEECKYSTNVEIEFTFTDISSFFFIEAKQKFKKFKSDRINIVFRVADITKDFTSQGFNIGCYDFVVMYLVFHVATHIESSISYIYKLLKPNGKLLFIELMKDSITQDLIIGNLDQWWGFKDFDIRPNHCCLNPTTWRTLFQKHGFINTVITPELNDCVFNTFIILTHKPTIEQLVTQQQLSTSIITTHQYNQCIIYYNSNNSANNRQYIGQLQEFYNNISKSVSIINNIDEMKRLTLSDQDIIIFSVGIESLTQDNFINIDMEYTSINQILLSGSIRCKHVLLTLNAQLESENYLNSSLIGIYRSFCEFKELNNYSIDIDHLNQNYIPKIEYITNQDHFIEREFVIRNDQVLVEHWGKETKPQPSTSFETNHLGFILDINLEPKLKSFNPELQKDQVLVRVKSYGLNFRDTLYHRGIGDIEPVIEFSGDVIKVHESVTNLKVGDSVLGLSNITVKDAYSFMIERKNIGKIVISDLDDTTLNQTIKDQLFGKKALIKQNYSINQNNIGKTILITGQTGVAFETIKWIIKYSKEPVNIIVLSQSAIKFELEFIKIQYENNNETRIHFKQLDISKIDQVRNAINDVYNGNSMIEPVESIFHFAFALADCLPQDISLQHLEKGHSAKTIGALNLHNLSIEFKWKLKNFILNSSAAFTNGSKYQCSYMSSNSVINSFSKYRRSLGLPCTTIIWGSLSVGGIHETVSMSKKFVNAGFKMLSVDKILGCIDYALEHNQQDILCSQHLSIIGFDSLLLTQ